MDYDEAIRIKADRGRRSRVCTEHSATLQLLGTGFALVAVFNVVLEIGSEDVDVLE